MGVSLEINFTFCFSKRFDKNCLTSVDIFGAHGFITAGVGAMWARFEIR